MVSLSHLRSVIFELFWSLPPAAEGRASGGKKRHEEKAWNASRRRWSRCTLGPLAAGLEAEEGRKNNNFKKWAALRAPQSLFCSTVVGFQN